MLGEPLSWPRAGIALLNSFEELGENRESGLC